MSTEKIASRPMRAMDFIVAVSLLLTIVASACATFVKDQPALNRWLDSHFLIIGAVGLGECALLLVWMALGGQTFGTGYPRFAFSRRFCGLDGLS
jgi:hypothetical protein